jgi:hypothetical protein
MLTCFAAISLALTARQAAPTVSPTEIVVPYEAGREVKVRVASSPLRFKWGPGSLLRIGTLRMEIDADHHATAELQGSILTAAKADYPIAVSLRDGADMEIAAGSVVEHIEHMELGRPVTILRKWTVDLGRRVPARPPKSVRIQITEEHPKGQPRATKIGGSAWKGGVVWNRVAFPLLLLAPEVVRQAGKWYLRFTTGRRSAAHLPIWATSSRANASRSTAFTSETA